MTARVPALLADENVPGPSIRTLRSRGWDVAWVAESAAGVTDKQVVTRAADESRWLITFDRDYGELAFRGRLRLPPAIVLLRIVSYRPAEPAEWIERVLASGKAAEGGFFVVDRLGLRWRPLPADRE